MSASSYGASQYYHVVAMWWRLASREVPPTAKLRELDGRYFLISEWKPISRGDRREYFDRDRCLFSTLIVWKEEYW